MRSSATAVVDFGTSHTVTVVSAAAGGPTVVSVDGEPWCPSAVYWGADGTPSVGADALRLGRAQPARLEPRPKARITEPEVLLADTVVPTTALVRAVLSRVVSEAARVAGGPVQHLALTHPADWGASRLGVLLSAAQGLAPRLSTVAEPVGAAAWFAERHELPEGAHLAVLDMGGGTCDAAIVSRAARGLTIAACAGLPDLGGNDLDERIVTHLRQRHVELDRYLADREQGGQVPAEEMVALARFRADVRDAKEVLSRYPHADVVLPGRLGEAILTRAEFEDLVRDDLRRAVGLLAGTARDCGLGPADLAAVHLVGGSSRVPLLAQLLQEWTPAPVRLDDQPEAVVALGAHTVAAGTDGVESVTEALAAAPRPSGDRTQVVAAPVPPAVPGRRRSWLAPAAVGLAASLVAVLVPVLLGDGGQVTAGAPRPGGEPRVTLPEPPPGEPFAIPGDFTDELPAAKTGQQVALETSATKVNWRLDEFADDEEGDRALVDAGNQDADAYRWILVRTTVGPRAEPDYMDMGGHVHLVDDRGMMISPIRNAALPDDCRPEDRNKLVQPGKTVGQCLAFQVSASTPITDVVLSVLSPTSPGSPGSELAGAGYRVPVTGRRVSGQRKDVTERAVPLGVWQDVEVNDVRARVAMVDLVEDITGYFEESTLRGLAGSRGVVLRIVVDVDRPTSAYFLSNRVFVADDRGTALFPAFSGGPRTHGCHDGTEQENLTGRATLCELFVVPTGMPISAVGITGVKQAYAWRVDR
ncbi:Hsp70 family protein [Actinophytocola sp.]|uniref:Hsp70 family protein n=1 Tax=Actinophytocola sp. TaxID=1872138 RepID=UPI003D6A73BD